MHMAVAETYSADEWLAVNTGYCLRYRARITTVVCQQNQQKSQGDIAGDCRCEGCGGLDNQPDPAARPRPILTAVAGGQAASPEEAGAAEIDPLTRALAGALQAILDGEEELDWEPVEALVDVIHDGTGPEAKAPPLESAEPVDVGGLDSLTRALLAELQGLDEEEGPEPARAMVEIREPAERKRRVRVFTGRCHRCNGFMVHAAKECHGGETDDEVYRCWNCSWRVSPAYDYNRKHPGEGWR